MKRFRFPAKYSTRCPGCGIQIEVGVNVFGAKKENGKWDVICSPCYERQLEVEKDFMGAAPDEAIVEVTDPIAKAMMAVAERAAIEAFGSPAFGKGEHDDNIESMAFKFTGDELKDFQPPEKPKEKPKPVGALELFKENADWS